PLHSASPKPRTRRRREDTNQPHTPSASATGGRTGRAPRRGAEAGGGKSSTSAALGAQPAPVAPLVESQDAEQPRVIGIPEPVVRAAPGDDRARAADMAGIVGHDVIDLVVELGGIASRAHRQ